jgi:hypothetical protein
MTTHALDSHAPKLGNFGGSERGSRSDFWFRIRSRIYSTRRAISITPSTP